MAQHQPIPLDKFDADIKSRYVGAFDTDGHDTCTNPTEVSSAALGGKVLSCSDDFFVSRHNLIKPTVRIASLAHR